MNKILSQIIKSASFLPLLRDWTVKIKQTRELARWGKGQKKGPAPHIIKQRTLRTYAKNFGLRTLVETGTYYGDMVAAMKSDFDHILSIELSGNLHNKARKRFKKNDTIELIHGDSGIELLNVIKRLQEPALFWLDGHYSSGETAKGEKETPIYEELMHIFSTKEKGHVIIIDDARCFGTDPAYPSLEKLIEFVKSKNPDTNVSVQDDSIRITPKLHSSVVSVDERA